MVFADVRYTLRRRASKDWPTTVATIESGISRYRLPSVLYRVYFTYSYRVGELRHDGRFFLLVNSWRAGEDVRQKLVGKNVLAKYDDRKPEVAFLIDQELAEKRVMQGPSWTYR